jgi:hypothetical protein
MSRDGSYLAVKARRWKGTEQVPVYTKELDYLVKTFQVRPYDLRKCYDDFEEISVRRNIITNAGRDRLHTQGYITPAVTPVFQWIAVTSSTVAPAPGDTTLDAEIVDANGLARAVATTDTHTGGTNTSTIGITFTATGSYTAVQKGMLFTLSAAGVGANEATFSSTNLASGDALQLTWTVTLG